MTLFYEFDGALNLRLPVDAFSNNGRASFSDLLANFVVICDRVNTAQNWRGCKEIHFRVALVGHIDT